MFFRTLYLLMCHPSTSRRHYCVGSVLSIVMPIPEGSKLRNTERGKLEDLLLSFDVHSSNGVTGGEDGTNLIVVFVGCAVVVAVAFCCSVFVVVTFAEEMAKMIEDDSVKESATDKHVVVLPWDVIVAFLDFP